MFLLVMDQVNSTTCVRSQKEAVDNEDPDKPFYFPALLKGVPFPFSSKGIEKVNANTEIFCQRVEFPEIMLTVQLHRPISRMPIHKNAPVDQEFHVIGQNLLSELRDEIGCVSDNAIPGEFSEDPDMQPEDICLKDIYKSGFFFINGVFYNDLRKCDAKDYSKLIIDWASKRDGNIGPFEIRPMEETRFIDLTIRLGYPYVYIHQGSCEHFLVFSDVRLMTKDDSSFRESYPRFSRHISKHRTFCMVCLRQGANWVVTESCRLPDTPYYFCDHCFRSFHYKKTGTKIGEFKARKIIDRSVLI